MAKKFTLETLRQIGICSYYNKLLKAGDDVKESIYKTSVHARLSERQTKKIINAQTAHSSKFGGAEGTKCIAQWIVK